MMPWWERDDMAHWGTMKMTPEFMQEMDDLEATHDPEFEGQRSYMSVTTDGSDVSREDVEAAVREWVQARIDGKCVIMDSFPEEPRRKRAADEFLSEVFSSVEVTKKVRRGCPSAGQLCACLGVCNDILDVPLNDPRRAIADTTP